MNAKAIKLARGLILMVVLSVSCTQGTPLPTSTPTIDAVATSETEAKTARDAEVTANAKSTAEAEVQKGTEEALVAQATLNAQATMDAQATLDAQATQDALATAAAQQTATKEAKDATATARAAASATAIAQKTETAGGMYERVMTLHNDGFLASTGGVYKKAKDFNESWAQLNWYRSFDTLGTSKNFVLHANVAYESASNTADWWVSGCGFVFRETDNDNHYMIYLAMDGNVYMLRQKSDNIVLIGSGFYGSMDIPKGSAEILFAAEDDYFTFYVNGKKVLRQYETTHKRGGLAYTLISGTNKDFGISCKMTNVEIWELK